MSKPNIKIMDCPKRETDNMIFGSSCIEHLFITTLKQKLYVMWKVLIGEAGVAMISHDINKTRIK